MAYLRWNPLVLVVRDAEGDGAVEIDIPRPEAEASRTSVDDMVLAQPGWSPDGSRIAVGVDDALIIARLEDRSVRRLERPCFFPVWGPGGAWIAAVTWDEGSESHPLQRIWVDEDRRETLLEDVALTPCPISPGGRWIAAARIEAFGEDEKRLELVVVDLADDPEGGSRLRAAPISLRGDDDSEIYGGMTWSRTGSVLHAVVTNGGRSLWVSWDVESNDLEQGRLGGPTLTGPAGRELRVASPSPDGRRFFAYLGKERVGALLLRRSDGSSEGEWLLPTHEERWRLAWLLAGGMDLSEWIMAEANRQVAGEEPLEGLAAERQAVGQELRRLASWSRAMERLVGGE